MYVERPPVVIFWEFGGFFNGKRDAGGASVFILTKDDMGNEGGASSMKGGVQERDEGGASASTHCPPHRH